MKGICLRFLVLLKSQSKLSFCSIIVFVYYKCLNVSLWEEGRKEREDVQFSKTC